MDWWKSVAGLDMLKASVEAGLLPPITDPASLEATRLPGGSPDRSLLLESRPLAASCEEAAAQRLTAGAQESVLIQPWLGNSDITA